MTTLVQDIPVMQRAAEDFRHSGKRIGVVPTMGFLHEGHLKLIQVAREHADIVITTVFVNPTQFGPSEDFERYPRNLDRDCKLASDAGSDYVFAPSTDAMYPAGYRTYIDVTMLDAVLEGRSRPGHFRGVATIVAKLFNITHPHIATFGQKDAQQVVIVKKLVEDMNLGTQIIVVPIVRERDGLAMSSRNVYLSSVQRKEAPILFRSLKLAEEQIRHGERSSTQVIRATTEMIGSASSASIDYISIADSETLDEVQTWTAGRELLVSLAVRFGATRLIDNTIVVAK